MTHPHFTKLISSSLLFSSVAVALVGCGANGTQGKLVQSVAVKTFTQDGDAWGEFKTTFGDKLNFSLPITGTIPISDPKKPGTVYGSVGFVQNLGSSELLLSVNISKISKSPSLITTLPNGTQAPIGGVDGANMIGFNLQKGMSIYGSFSAQSAAIGVALKIKELDKVGQSVCLPLNLMPAFNFGAGIRGIAGVFTGCDVGQSGIAIFIDATQAMQNDTLPKMMLASGDVLEFNDVHPENPEDEAKLIRALMKMKRHSKGKQLHAQD
jgi:hypothetical protein